MKGGKDMKRTYKFEEEEDKYSIKNEDNEIFVINKDNLKIDGNKFYEFFFHKHAIDDTINLEVGVSVDDKNKLSSEIYETLNKLINDIVKKIVDQHEE